MFMLILDYNSYLIITPVNTTLKQSNLFSHVVMLLQLYKHLNSCQYSVALSYYTAALTHMPTRLKKTILFAWVGQAQTLRSATDEVEWLINFEICKPKSM